MPDIFISYSSKDREQAEQLAERLTSAGHSCWIDRQGITGAEQWATEIVEGIKACSTFAVLLSERSVASEHVLRELSLAIEKRKRVLPIDLEAVLLPSSFEYPLAGLTRVAFSDFAAILHAHRHGVTRVVKKDERKSLMILPFADLSQTNDHAWFADGVASELVGALTNIKALRLIDWNTSKLFRDRTIEIEALARELDVRYFIEGQVRTLGEQVKISVTLLDVATHEYLWHDAFRGEMKNIFDIQEEVAQKVVDGFRLHLSGQEQKKLKERGTENEEAFLLAKQAVSYADRQTQEGLQHAVDLLSQAIALDPRYAEAMRSKAYTLCELFRAYDRDPAYLQEAERLAVRALEIRPDLHRVYGVFASLYRLQEKFPEAKTAAMEYVRRMPEEYWSHFSLGYLYMETGRFADAVPHFRDALERKPGDLTSYFNLFVVSEHSAEGEGKQRWSREALPHFEKHLRLVPDDETARVWYSLMLYDAGKTDEANASIKTLLQKKHLDAGSLYNIASYYAAVVDPPEPEMALAVLKRSVAEGYGYLELLEQWHEIAWMKEHASYAAALDEIIASVRHPPVAKEIDA